MCHERPGFRGGGISGKKHEFGGGGGWFWNGLGAHHSLDVAVQCQPLSHGRAAFRPRGLALNPQISRQSQDPASAGFSGILVILPYFLLKSAKKAVFDVSPLFLFEKRLGT